MNDLTLTVDIAIAGTIALVAFLLGRFTAPTPAPHTCPEPAPALPRLPDPHAAPLFTQPSSLRPATRPAPLAPAVIRIPEPAPDSGRHHIRPGQDANERTQFLPPVRRKETTS